MALELYKDSVKVKTVSFEDKLIPLIYKGSELVWCVYPVGSAVFEEESAGTYTFTPLATGTYEISLVGPGSGGTAAGDQAKYADKSRGAGGGSGAYVCGVWKLTAGTPYTIVVGAGAPAGPTTSNNGYSQAAGDSSFGDFLVCGGGGGATAIWKSTHNGGDGGAVKTCVGYNRLISRIVGNKGNSGGGYTYYAGGESVFPPHGAGGYGQATGNYAGKSSAGENGYCKIRFLLDDEVEIINVNFVGNVNFDNGLVNNFTTANYLMLPEDFISDEITEGMVTFTTANDITTAQGLFLTTTSDDSSSFGVSDGVLKLINKIYGSGTSSVSLGLSLTPNTKYYFKFTQNDTSITPYISTDGVDFIQGTTVTRSREFGKWLGYGLGNDVQKHFLGSIDLAHSYIKANGELYWKGIKRLFPRTFTINASPENAVVIINGEQRNSLTSLEDIKISWSVSLDGYKTQSGTLTLTEDTVLDVVLEEVFYIDWTQPVLKSDTSHGELTTSGYRDIWKPWYAFDGKIGGSNKYLGPVEGGYIVWRTPEAIKIKSCKVYTTTETDQLNRFPHTITIYGSDDGVDWVEIGSLSGYEQPASGESVTIPCNATKTYAYTKWEFSTGFGDVYYGIAVSEIEINAVYVGA